MMISDIMVVFVNDQHILYKKPKPCTECKFFVDTPDTICIADCKNNDYTKDVVVLTSAIMIRVSKRGCPLFIEK